MGRRRFDHFYTELCCALGARLPRYALWLELGKRGYAPEGLARSALLAFYDGDLAAFLALRGMCLSDRASRQLRRSLERFDPAVATPAEIFARISAPAAT